LGWGETGNKWDWNKSDEKSEEKEESDEYMPWKENKVQVTKKKREYKPWKYNKKDVYSGDDSQEEDVVTSKTNSHW
jgi:hypothetical protein